MNKPEPIPTDPTMLAILHRTGMVWRGMAVSARGTQPSIIASREFAADQTPRIDSWLDEHQVSQVLCVLPSSCVICRNSSLPDASPEQLEQALRLQAEAHLLGMAPPHRLAMAVLPIARGETNRNGLILAWPEAADFKPPIGVSRPITFVPDVAAIAALLNGSRPTQPLLWLDRADGSVALGLTHSAGAVFRGTHEESESSEAWMRAVGRMVAETGLSVGHTGPFIETATRQAQSQASSLSPGKAALFVPDEVIAASLSKIKGASDDNSWWAQWGLMVGAVLARTGSLQALTQMQFAPPVEAPSRVRSVLGALSRPNMAGRLAVACVLVLALGPLVFAGLRLGVLMLRHGNLETELADVRKLKAQAAIYEELQKQHVWPMAKLMGDIVSNAPEGIELEVIKVDGGQTFAVSGTTRNSGTKTATEIVAAMQEYLRSSRQFEDIVLNWGQGNNMGVYKFDLSAKVAKPYKMVSYDTPRDFKLWTLQMRQAGDPAPTGAAGTGSMPANPPDTALAASSTSQAPAPPAPAANETSENQPPEGALAEATEDPEEADNSGGSPQSGTRRFVSESSRNLGSNTSGVDGRGDSAIPPQFDIPPAITQEQIDKMTKEEARAELYKRAVAEKNITDKAEKERITNERRLLIDHLKKR